MIEIVVNLLKHFLGNELINLLKGMLPGVINKEVNNLLNQLPLNIDISSDISMSYEFNDAPVIRDGYLLRLLLISILKVNLPHLLELLRKYQNLIQRTKEVFNSFSLIMWQCLHLIPLLSLVFFIWILINLLLIMLSKCVVTSHHFLNSPSKSDRGDSIWYM